MCMRVFSLVVVLNIWKLGEVMTPNPPLSLGPIKSSKSFPASFSSFRKHCRSGRLGECTPHCCQSRTSSRRETSQSGTGTPRDTGTSHPSTKAPATTRGTSWEAFQGHSSHPSTFRWAITNILTPVCGNPLVQVTT